MSDFLLHDFYGYLKGDEKEAKPIMNDLAFKVNEIIEVNKGYENLIGEILATLSLPTNQEYPISGLYGLKLSWLNKYHRLQAGIT